MSRLQPLPGVGQGGGGGAGGSPRSAHGHLPSPLSISSPVLTCSPALRPLPPPPVGLSVFLTLCLCFCPGLAWDLGSDQYAAGLCGLAVTESWPRASLLALGRQPPLPSATRPAPSPFWAPRGHQMSACCPHTHSANTDRGVSPRCRPRCPCVGTPGEDPLKMRTAGPTWADKAK